jgi:hypothetical protein
MTSYALSLPRAATGGPRRTRDRATRVARDWWVDCKAILQSACPLVAVPSPVREALAHLS